MMRILNKIKHKIENFLSLIYTGETLDESDARERRNFENLLIEKYKEIYGTNIIPFNLNTLSIKGLIDCKVLLDTKDLDIEHVVQDINNRVFENIWNNKFQNNLFDIKKYYKKN